nr:unnamed protein product [Spirometra erinaceieuropaei]
MDNFACLGGTLSRNTNIDDAVALRLFKGSHAFSRLQASARNCHGLQTSSELMMYKAVALTTLLHGAEIWTVYSSHGRKLNHIRLTCIHRILKQRWQNRKSDTGVLGRTEILKIHAMLRQLPLRSSGQLMKMDDARLSKQLSYGNVARGCSPAGRAKTTP